METGAAASPDALSRELARERIQSARRINLAPGLRVSRPSSRCSSFSGVSCACPGGRGTSGSSPCTGWWRRRCSGRAGASSGAARLASLAIALVDVPMVFFLQWATLATSPSASGVAGFTVGVYVLLVILAALSLENRLILLTATFAAFFEILLQHLAGVGEGAMVSTVILLGLGAAACSYARLRLVALVERVERDIAEQRRAEAALRQAERTAGAGRAGAGAVRAPSIPPRWPSAPSTASRICSGLRPPRSSASSPPPALSSPSRPAARFSRASPPGRS